MYHAKSQVQGLRFQSDVELYNLPTASGEVASVNPSVFERKKYNNNKNNNNNNNDNNNNNNNTA